MINKKYIFLIIILFCGIVYFHLFGRIKSDQINGQLHSQVQVGDKLPDVFFNEIIANNKELVLGEKKILILNFWASWCSPCVEEFPSLIKLSKLLGDKLTVFAISQDTDVSELNAFLKIYEVSSLSSFRVVDDGKHVLSGILAVDRLPETWIVSSDRVLLKKVVGAIDWSSEDVVSFLKSNK